MLGAMEEVEHVDTKGNAIRRKWGFWGVDAPVWAGLGLSLLLALNGSAVAVVYCSRNGEFLQSSLESVDPGPVCIEAPVK